MAVLFPVLYDTFIVDSPDTKLPPALALAIRACVVNSKAKDAYRKYCDLYDGALLALGVAPENLPAHPEPRFVEAALRDQRRQRRRQWYRNLMRGLRIRRSRPQ